MTECGIVQYTDNPITADSLFRLWNDFPKALDLPNGKRLVSPVGNEHVGLEMGGFRFVKIVRVDWRKPGRYYTLESETWELAGGTLTATRVWTPWSQQEIDADKAVRKQDAIDSYLLNGPAFVSFAIAKQINPNMTKAQFKSFVENNWPDTE